ncbi:hypothetical protein CVD19_13555 [Bacillus sp. T33-2]|nr:hypothetical protein CVD19_13555 [Bacillus sp. T33-2]
MFISLLTLMALLTACSSEEKASNDEKEADKTEESGQEDLLINMEIHSFRKLLQVCSNFGWNV